MYPPQKTVGFFKKTILYKARFREFDSKRLKGFCLNQGKEYYEWKGSKNISGLLDSCIEYIRWSRIYPLYSSRFM
jgi:hypothetical protein